MPYSSLRIVDVHVPLHALKCPSFCLVSLNSLLPCTLPFIHTSPLPSLTSFHHFCLSPTWMLSVKKPHCNNWETGGRTKINLNLCSNVPCVRQCYTSIIKYLILSSQQPFIQLLIWKWKCAATLCYSITSELTAAIKSHYHHISIHMIQTSGTSNWLHL